MTPNRKWTAILLAVLCLAGFWAWKEWSLNDAQRDFVMLLDQQTGNYNEDRVVLSSTTRWEAEHMAEEFGGTLRITKDGRFAVINLPEGMTLSDIAENDDYRKYHDRILLDYNNFSTADENIVDDTQIRSGYVVEDPMYAQQTYIDYLNIGGAWDLTRGADSNGEKVVVAVIDTGIDTDHPEFYDADGNSIISTQSYDATNDKVVDQYDISVIEDTNGHGTAVAGIIAAQMNTEGIAGIAPDVELLVIKCENDEAGEFKSSADIVFAIYYAIEMDVDVINMSLGGSGGSDMAKAIQLAVDNDIICVAAAGNAASEIPHYPAAYETVIGVGALAEGSWDIADYSNFGINSDIMAPGTALTAAAGGDYTYQSGTSISAPMVTAAVALYKAQNKYVTYHDLRADLLAAGKDLGNLGEDNIYGFGALDVNAFICAEKGTITYDYCTEEIGSTTQVFVRRNTIQTVPEPERDNIVFDDWYYDKAYTKVFDYDAWYSTEFVEDVTLYAKWVNEDDEDASAVFNYHTLSDGSIEIVSYQGKRRYLTIPNEIDGKIVSSIGTSAFAVNGRLREVILPEGLVCIKTHAFSSASRLRGVTFTGNKLAYIGDNAFSQCKSLRKLDLPDSVITIGSNAFNGCSAMNAVTISENSSLETLGDFAFSGTAISSFYIPANVNAVGFNGSVLSGCSAMRVVSVHPQNTAFTADRNTLYNTEKTRIVYYPAAITGSYTVADGVNAIGQYAFYGSAISDLNLNHVVSIGASSFESTRKLGSVVLPDTVTVLEARAFAYSSIKQATLSANISVISNETFTRAKLTGISIPAGVMSIGENAFAYCSYLQSLIFADSSQLSTIGKGAFANCNILKNFILPNSLATIGEGAFEYCRMITELTIPTNVSSLGKKAFQGCSLLQQVVFTDSCKLSSIPELCFANCTALHTVHFSDGIVCLGSDAFKNDRMLQKLNFGENSCLTTVEDYCFYFCSSLSAMQLPQSVTTIGQFAYTFSGLTSVEVNANMTSIGNNAFGACYLLKKITVDEANTVYAVLDNVLFNKDITTVFCVPASRTGSYTLPSTVRVTAPYSFYYNKFLTAVILPQNLEDIQMNSFYSCSSLTGIEIPAKVTNIGRQAFEDCYSMASVTFSEGSCLKRLGIYTFVNCGMTEITIPSSVEEIAQYVFLNCNNLQKINFEKNSMLTYVAAYLFAETKVESVIFEEGSALLSLQAHAFDGASYLKTVDFGDAKLTNVDNYAFYNCANLETISLPETVTYVGRYAFYGCSGLDRIDLPASVDYVGESAFIGTNNIRVFFAADNLPANVQTGWDNGISGYFLGVVDYVVTDEWEYSVMRDRTIALSVYKGNAAELTIDTVDGYTVSRLGARCFMDNDTLKSITLSENITEIGNYAFYDCDGLTSIALPASVVRIGKYAFAESSPVVSFAENSVLQIIDDYALAGNSTATLNLPDTVTSIGDGAFLNSSLTSVNISQTSTLETVGQQAFKGCGITNVYLPASLKTVGAEAFKGVTSLSSVEIAVGDQALKLSNGAFEGCGIGEITIPARVWYIGEYTLGSCQNLQNIHVDSGNASYTSLDGVLCNFGVTTLIQYPCGRSGVYEVPAQINVLNYACFRDAKHLTEVSFAEGSTVHTIGWQTFSGCECLTKITVPDTVVSFDLYAFENCYALTDVILDEGTQLTGVHEGAFYNCTALANISLPDTVVEISDYAFYNCGSLSAFPLSGNSQVKGVYDYAFYGCSGITEIPALPQLTEIGEYAFAYTGIADYTVGAAVQSIASNVFTGCENLAAIYCDEANEAYTSINGAIYEKGVASAANYDALVAWPYANVLVIGLGKTEITVNDTEFIKLNPVIRWEIADSVTVIGEKAFCGHPYLTSIILPDGITKIDKEAFKDCISLVQISLPDSLSVIGNNAFQNCRSLTSIEIPENISNVGVAAFAFCTSLTDIYFNAADMPDAGSGASFFTYAGSDGEGITVTVGNQVKRIPAHFFRDSYSSNKTSSYITSFVFEEGSVCESIGERAFENCASLKKVTIPSSVKSIAGYSFLNCKKIEEIFWNASVTSISGDVFHNAGADGPGITLTIGSEASVIPNYLFGNSNGTAKLVDVRFEANSICTSVGSNTFSGCKDLVSITLPQSLTRIGSAAFSSCTQLTEIVIPQNVNTIGYSAFSKCSELLIMFEGNALPQTLGPGWSGDAAVCINPQYFGVTEYGQRYWITEDNTATIWKYRGAATRLDIPETIDGFTITEIAASAFNGCAQLREVSLPSSITSIGNSAFAECRELAHVVIPENVTIISPFVFSNCTNLTDIAISESVTTIGEGAFSGCSGLKSILIPSSVSQIGNYAFSECVALTQVYYNVPSLKNFDPNNYVFSNAGTAGEGISVIIGASVEYIPGYLFSPYYSSYSPNIKLVVFEENSKCRIIGAGAFYYCESLTEIVLPDSLLTIGNSAFQYCKNLLHINIPYKVSTVGSAAFSGCSKLDGIWADERNTVFFTDKQGVLYNRYSSSIIRIIQAPSALEGAYSAAEGTTHVGQSAFSSCNQLTSVTLPEGVTTIETNAFAGCGKLEEVSFPNSLITIGANSFKGCNSLESVTIPCNVSRIVSGSFTNCSSLTSITFVGDAPIIDDSAFTQVTATAFYPQNNETWTSDKLLDYGGSVTWEAYIHEHNYETVVKAPTCTEQGYTTYTCPTCGHSYVDDYEDAPGHQPGDPVVENQVEVTCETDGRYDKVVYCTACNEELNRETVVETATGHSMEHVIVDPTCSERGYTSHTCTTCGYHYADSYVNALGHTYVDRICSTCGEVEVGSCGDNVRWTFNVETGELVIFTEGDVSPQDCAMEDYDSVKDVPWYPYRESILSIIVEDSVGHIGNYAFAQCANLTDVSIADSVTSIGKSAFWVCTNLADIAIPDSVISIGYGAFSNCSLLTEITIPENVTSISDFTFSNCTQLSKIELPEGVLSIGQYAFNNCSNLKSISLPYGITSIGKCAFQNCSGLTSIIVPDSVTSIGMSAFRDCSSLTSIVLSNNITALDDFTFYSCGKLTEIVIPSKVSSIGYTVFYMCRSLESVTFTGDAPTMASSVFYGVVATAYYPANNETWTADVKQNYSGTITWKVLCNAHHYEAVVTDPTCTEQGYTTYTCSNCGDSYVEDLVPATGHNFVDGMCSCGAEIMVMDNRISYTVSGQIVTVSCEHPCRVGYWDEDRLQYIAIPAVANKDGSYSFAASGDAVKLLIVITGDMNGDGKITAPDIARLNAHLKGKTVLTAEVLFAADVNFDGKLDANDKSAMSKAILGITPIRWEVKTEE